MHSHVSYIYPRNYIGQELHLISSFAFKIFRSSRVGASTGYLREHLYRRMYVGH